MSIHGMNILLSIGVLYLGLLFLGGLFRNKMPWFGWLLNTDSILFPFIKDERIFRSGDRVAFLVCATSAFLTVFTTIVSLLIPKIPNFGFVFLVFGLVLVFPARVIFLVLNKHKTFLEVPRIWPFQN